MAKNGSSTQHCRSVCLFSLVVATLSWVVTCNAQPIRSQFFELVKGAIDNATSICVFKLQRELLADDPQMTIGDLPSPISERRLKKNDEELRFILGILENQNSYDFEHMVPKRTRALYGVMFHGPTETSALLLPLPVATNSLAVTVRFVTQRPTNFKSTALLVDAKKLLRNIDLILH